MNILIQRVTDDDLISRIKAARRSVALYAPGVTTVVADALCDAIRRLGGAAKVVFDVSQKSVDMGYLEPDSVAKIWFVQNEVSPDVPLFYHLSGLRLGVLFVDDGSALVYAPSARLMEDENFQIVRRCPSGVEVFEGSVEFDLRDMAQVAVDQVMVDSLCGAKLKPGKPLSEIKREYEAKIAESETRVREAEERAQKAEEQAAKAVQNAVDEYKKQFKIRKVEFSVHSQPTAIGRKRVKMPSMFLVGVGNEAEEKLMANYRLFPDEKEIEEMVLKGHPNEGIAEFAAKEMMIRDTYLICVPRFGSYVKCDQMAAFNKAVEELRELGKKVGEHIREALESKVDGAIEKLFSILNDRWAKTRDPWFVEFQRKHPDDHRSIHELFVDVMKNGEGGISSVIDKFSPEIDCFSTPIDEGLANDQKFIAALEKTLAKRAQEGRERLCVEDLIAFQRSKGGGETSETDGTCGTVTRECTGRVG